MAANEGLLALGFLWQGNAFTNGESAQRASTADPARRKTMRHRRTPFPLIELARFVGFSPRKVRIGLRLLHHMATWRFVPTAEQIGWIEQFTDRPSTTQAFLGWTGDLHQNVTSNTARIASLQSFDRPVTVAFGRYDPYITPSVATEIAALFPNSTAQLVDAGHWLQLEQPQRVAEIVLAAPS